MLTYAILRVNFPLVSNVCSCFLDSTPYKFIFPEWLPEIINLSSGENATVQISTGPTSIAPILFPVSMSHSLKLESSELEAQTKKKKVK